MAESICSVFRDHVRRYSDRPAMRYKEGERWKTITWGELGRRTERLAVRLIADGIGVGDRVAIYSYNRPEWTMSDMAVLLVRGVPVTIYHTSTPEQVHYLLDHSGAKLVFVEGKEQLRHVLAVQKRLPDLRTAVCFDAEAVRETSGGDPGFRVVSFSDYLAEPLPNEAGCAALLDERVAAIDESDPAGIIYTSGTSGPPKGCIITHRGILYTVKTMDRLFAEEHFAQDIDRPEVTCSFLPLAHALERHGGQFMAIYLGPRSITAFPRSIDTLIDDLSVIRPTYLRAVPRVFEKVYQRVWQSIEQSPVWKRRLFEWSLEVGRQCSDRIQNKQPIPFMLKMKNRVARRLVFQNIHDRLGGRLRYAFVGGAPMNPEIARFFHRMGLLILEGYGQTEVTIMATVNRPGDFRFGTVGKPIPGVEIALAEDGEIWVKGPNAMAGYYKDQEKTAETLRDGWVRTGDVGRLDEEGFLIITDRKKDLIILSSGKNIAPQNVENVIKTDPLFSQVVVIGDNRPYLVALVALDEEEVNRWADERGFPRRPMAEWIRDPALNGWVAERLRRSMRHLPRWEQVKKFRILERDLTQEEDQLTPTLKVKRSVVENQFRDLIEAMYAEPREETAERE